MSKARSGSYTVRTPWKSVGRGRRLPHSEEGLTLVELLIVIVILPFVVGGITVALISVFSLQSSVSNRISDSSDAQVVSANYVTDIQSASSITSDSTATLPKPCGSSSQVLGLLEGSGQTEVSYVDVPLLPLSSNMFGLSRKVCLGGTLGTPLTLGQTGITSLALSSALTSTMNAGDNITIGCALPSQLVGCSPSGASAQTVQVTSAAGIGATTINVASFTSTFAQPVGAPIVDSSTPASTSFVSRNVPSNLTVTIACATTVSNCATAAAGGWTATAGVAGATLAIGETLGTGTGADKFNYALTGVPRDWNSNTGGVPASASGHLPLLLLGNSGASLSCTIGTLNIQGEAALDSTSSGAVSASFATISASEFYTADQTDPPTALFSNFFGTISPSTLPVSGPPVADPYASLTPPSPAGLTRQNQSAYNGTGSVVIPAGYYPNQLEVSGYSNVTLSSGIYYLADGADFNFTNVTSAAGGVFIYVAGGSLDILFGSTTLTPLASPPSPAANLVIWQAAADNNLIGTGLNTGSISIDGTIYAPSALVGSGLSLGGSFSASSVVAQGLACFVGNMSIGALPTVSALSTSSGSAGTAVTITGSNFVPGATVAFGEAAATNVTVNSSASITAIAPAGSGTVNVTVTTASGTSSISNADQFTYT